MTAYYNEIDPYAAQWLRNLIAKKLIAPGDVDERSIVNVQPDDLKGYTQCHFFAGIGGWSYAARLAGWPDEREMWTGSCPCQPFSSTGPQTGFSDQRDLWPEWYRLITKLKPSVVFGEQSEQAVKFGWADRAADEMEKEKYAFASAVLPACSVGAPHRRYRYWFVADSECKRSPSRIWKQPEPTAIKLAANSRGRFGYPVGKAWDCEPKLAEMVHGIPGGVAASSAYGNAIVPRVGAEFISSYMESTLQP
jgi:DNA (cytosine-5)-methyltransferase 1